MRDVFEPYSSRITLKHSWEHHISTQHLQQELGLASMDTYITRRQLRWLGHVRRMPFERLPRRMLSSWIPSARPTGAPRMAYKCAMYKALKKFHIETEHCPRSVGLLGTYSRNYFLLFKGPFIKTLLSGIFQEKIMSVLKGFILAHSAEFPVEYHVPPKENNVGNSEWYSTGGSVLRSRPALN